jgi:cytochrome c-type biogenesis protein CcmH/NrfG
MKSQPAKSGTGWTSVQIYTAIVVVAVLGVLAGYLLHNSGAPAESTALTSSTGMPPSQMPSPAQMLATQTQPLLERLKNNPKDANALISLGNVYFDAQQWPDAITYYGRALEQNPANPDVRTDMGVAYFYSGDADRALKEFDHALKDDPKHGQTMFNVGVVKLNGKKDPKGAVEAWETLLKIDPNYPDRVKVESMLTEAKAQIK